MIIISFDYSIHRQDKIANSTLNDVYFNTGIMKTKDLCGILNMNES